MIEYSTVEVARIIGVHKTTLLQWLYSGHLAEPKHVRHAGQDLRIWSEKDVSRAKRYKEQNYRKGRGRKKAA
jgi:ABC-type cobalamin transport system ATPase subunit